MHKERKPHSDPITVLRTHIERLVDQSQMLRRRTYVLSGRMPFAGGITQQSKHKNNIAFFILSFFCAQR